MNQIKYPKILMYSRDLCSDCIRSKAFLDHNAIPYEEINILRDERAKTLVINLNKGKATVPTIIIGDENNNIILSEPSDTELSIAISKMS